MLRCLGFSALFCNDLGRYDCEDNDTTRVVIFGLVILHTITRLVRLNFTF